MMSDDTVLVIGGGGREHAFAWKLAQSEAVGRVLVAPGNAGTATESKCTNHSLADNDIEGVVELAAEHNVDLVVIGPEAPLALGLADALAVKGIDYFGPSQQAAQLESSKAWAKAFMARYHIPTAQYHLFDNFEDAESFLSASPGAWVVKADGLAAGKGVFVCENTMQAIDATRDIFSGSFGAAGHRVIIEERLLGEEASFIALVDGEAIIPLASSQDHKARDAGDQGPNTGGMGAYTPAPVLDASLVDKVLAQVIEPTIAGLAAEGIRYRGFLYAGLMVSASGDVNVLEYNCRCGDPETQPLMMRMKSDFYRHLRAAVDGVLADETIDWHEGSALGVVLASAGYPGEVSKGDVISGVAAADNRPGIKVFQAGTALGKDGTLQTSGGRVLCVTGIGDTIQATQQSVYQAVGDISWTGHFYRGDIGYRASKRSTVGSA